MAHDDVLIVGGGPAGAAAAIVLAEAGKSVRVMVRPRTAADQFGESLSPGCAGLLQRLGCWDDFCLDGHLPCYANRSAWGSSQLRIHDYLVDPRGHGWHIDRGVFEQRLLDRAQSLGVEIQQQSLNGDMTYDGSTWLFEQAGDQVSAATVIDASGKQAWFAKRQNVERIIEQRQVALIALKHHQQPVDDTASLVETVPQGWWYLAPIPQQRFAVCFFTDADLHDANEIRTEEGWNRALSHSIHVKERLEQAESHFIAEPRFVDASSGFNQQIYGKGWLAVGDAAMNYDPLSAHGITLALRTGIDGAQALLAEQESAMRAYGSRVQRAVEAYLLECRRHYLVERRWSDEVYWERRQAQPQMLGF